MAGMRRKRTDNNSLILQPSGENWNDGIGKDSFSCSFYASCTCLMFSVQCLCMSVYVCMWMCELDMLEYSESPHLLGYIQNCVYVSITCTHGHMVFHVCVYVCTVLFMCILVHIHIPVYTGPCANTYLFAFCNQVRCPPPFCFVLYGSNESLTNSIQLLLQLQQLSPESVPGVGYLSKGPGHSVRVWERKIDWWLTVDSPVNRPTDWQVDVDVKATSGPLKPGHLIRFFVWRAIWPPELTDQACCVTHHSQPFQFSCYSPIKCTYSPDHHYFCSDLCGVSHTVMIIDPFIKVI